MLPSALHPKHQHCLSQGLCCNCDRTLQEFTHLHWGITLSRLSEKQPQNLKYWLIDKIMALLKWHIQPGLNTAPPHSPEHPGNTKCAGLAAHNGWLLPLLPSPDAQQNKRMLLCISAQSNETPVPINPQSSLGSEAHLRHCKSPANLAAWKQHLDNSLPHKKDLFLHRCDKPKPHCAAQLRIRGRIQSGIWVIATKKNKNTQRSIVKRRGIIKMDSYASGMILIQNTQQISLCCWQITSWGKSQIMKHCKEGSI